MNEFEQANIEEENNDKSLSNREEPRPDDDKNHSPDEENKNQFSESQGTEFKKDAVNNNKVNQEEAAGSDEKQKYSMSGDVHSSKYPFAEDNKETNNFSVNKKLRNTITGLSNNKMKYESGLIDIILKVESDNVNHYLRGDLAEMYHDINKNNAFFKNDVFLANVDLFEKNTGILDKKPNIPYNCSEDISIKLDKFPKTNEIIEKFTQKIKYFQ